MHQNQNKVMEECPYCNSKSIVKYGKRKRKREEIQIYKCSLCGKFFSDKKLKHKSYNPKIILNSISIYNLGCTLEETKKEMTKRFHIRIPESTIHSWIKEYSGICRFPRLREQATKLHKPEEMIFSRNLQHKQIYKF